MPTVRLVRPAKKIVPFDLSIPRVNKTVVETRLGINRNRLNLLIEDGELVVMAAPPGVMDVIVSASVDAYIAKLNAMATIPALTPNE